MPDKRSQKQLKRQKISKGASEEWWGLTLPDERANQGTTTKPASQLKNEPGGQQVINQTQTNTASGNTISGDFHFSPVQGLTIDETKRIIDESADKSEIWERIWDSKRTIEVQTDSKATSPAMYPVIVNENLDAVRHTLEIPDKSRIRFKIELNIEGYLLLFEKGTSGTIWCWCPSRFAPQTYLPKEGMTIPQINNRGEYIPQKHIWLEARSLQLMGKGAEYMLAILINDPPRIYLDRENKRISKSSL